MRDCRPRKKELSTVIVTWTDGAVTCPYLLECGLVVVGMVRDGLCVWGDSPDLSWRVPVGWTGRDKGQERSGLVSPRQTSRNCMMYRRISPRCPNASYTVAVAVGSDPRICAGACPFSVPKGAPLFGGPAFIHAGLCPRVDLNLGKPYSTASPLAWFGKTKGHALRKSIAVFRVLPTFDSGSSDIELQTNVLH